MRHLKLTNKEGHSIVLHHDDLIEAFPPKHGNGAICVTRIKRDDEKDTFILVNETPEEIYLQLEKLTAGR
jgi:hypothetical protein